MVGKEEALEGRVYQMKVFQINPHVWWCCPKLGCCYVPADIACDMIPREAVVQQFFH